jgi:hypothetical protein
MVWIDVLTAVVDDEEENGDESKEAKEAVADIRVPPIRSVWHPLAIAQTVAGHVSASKIEHFLPAHIQVCIYLSFLPLASMHITIDHGLHSYWMQRYHHQIRIPKMRPNNGSLLLKNSGCISW